MQVTGCWMLQPKAGGSHHSRKSRKSRRGTLCGTPNGGTAKAGLTRIYTGALYQVRYRADIFFLIGVQ